MNIAQAISGIKDAQHKLQSTQGTTDPVTLSEQMMRLASYTSALEEHLAELEKEYEEVQAGILKKYLVEQEIAITKADKLVKIELGSLKGQLAYVARLVSSSWKQCGIIQSRIKHLESQFNQGNRVT